MGLTLNGTIYGHSWLRELEYHYNGIVWAIFWDPNEASNIGEWSNMWRWWVREMLLPCRTTVTWAEVAGGSWVNRPAWRLGRAEVTQVWTGVM